MIQSDHGKVCLDPLLNRRLQPVYLLSFTAIKSDNCCAQKVFSGNGFARCVLLKRIFSPPSTSLMFSSPYQQQKLVGAMWQLRASASKLRLSQNYKSSWSDSQLGGERPMVASSLVSGKCRHSLKSVIKVTSCLYIV